VDRLQTLLGRLRQCCESFPDKRRGINTTYRIADIAMAAFSVFFMQSPSFLAHQRHLREGHGRSNCESLFGLSKIPSDNHIRDMLDPAAPALLYPVFAEVLAALEQSGGLHAFRRPGDHVLIALDGTEYFCSNKIGCAQCSKRLRANGKTEYYHAMLGATLVAPGHHHVVPLEPEFVSPQDGAEKQDCESRAARRWLAEHGRQYARMNPIYLGDDLFANQPLCEAVLAANGHFLFTCKPASHPLIQEYVTGVKLPSHTVSVKRGRKLFTHRFRWMSGVPLRDTKDALKVNWFEIGVSRKHPQRKERWSCMRDEGGAPRRRQSGAGVKPLQAAVVKSDGGERCSKRRDLIPSGMIRRGERKRTADDVSKCQG